ncbi:MAG: NRDE family protein [Saprospiraceae bacterium]
MCTVTYIPKSDGFILTHNRDEAPSRSLFSLETQTIGNDTQLLFPRDAKAGGTWIMASDGGRTACILNGAFVLHERKLPYRRSRGLMMFDFFEYDDPDDFFEEYDFEGIEPFTFLLFLQERVTELRWDAHKKHLKHLSSDDTHFWCSATLYPPDMQVKREAVFDQWKASLPDEKIIDPDEIINLHFTGSVGDPTYDFVMSRDGRVQTVSITQVLLDKKMRK